MTENQIIIRKARREDLAALVRLLADNTLGAQRERLQEPLPAAYITAFEIINRDPNCELVVAELAGELVGTLQINYLYYLSHQGGKRAQVESMHVGQAYRGQGIGQQMMLWAIGRARQEGCLLVQLTSHSSRLDAHRFYEKLGFVASHVGMKLYLNSTSA